MAKFIYKNNDYDYYIMLRTDCYILFDLPPMNIFELLPPSIYGFYTKYWEIIGNLGGHYIHKNYIVEYLNAPCNYIKSKENYNILNSKHNLWNLNTKYYNEIDKRDYYPDVIPHQETLFLLAFESYKLHIDKIRELPFYYNVDISDNYVFCNGYTGVTYCSNTNTYYKYIQQYNEANQNLQNWSEGKKWSFDLSDNSIYLR